MPHNKLLANSGGSVQVYILILSILISFQVLADSTVLKLSQLPVFNYTINQDLDMFSPDIDLEALIPRYIAKEVKDNKRDKPFYGPMCDHSMHQLTPDQEMALNYYSSWLTHVITFRTSDDIISYTPIRDIINAPSRPARFKGYYFISQ